MRHSEFLNDLKKYVAFLCIDISVLRNQSNPGSVEKCKRFCSNIDLEKFFDALRNDYDRYLDEQTDLLLRHCQPEELKFGSARKVLNIFFRHICYNGFMQNEYLKNEELYSNHSILSKLELPIDSRVAKRLDKGKWDAIIRLDMSKNKYYQELALIAAEKLSIARIHLDVTYWPNT